MPGCGCAGSGIQVARTFEYLLLVKAVRTLYGGRIVRPAGSQFNYVSAANRIGGGGEY